MVDAIVELKNITVHYQNKKVLGPITLKINPGDFLGVVGPNGAGKSTLIKIIAGLQHVSEGDVTVFCNSLNTGPIRLTQSLRNNIGILPQHHTFYPDLPFTVEDVVFFGRVGLPGLGQNYRSSDIETVNHVLSVLNLEHLRSRLYRELSGGERQKIQFARLLAQESEILLLDEPTAGLDLDWQGRLTRLVEDLYKIFDKTIIMVTHHVDHLPACCNRVLLLQNGEVLAVGKPSEVLRSDVLSNIYNCPIEVEERNGRFHTYSLGLKEN